MLGSNLCERRALAARCADLISLSPFPSFKDSPMSAMLTHSLRQFGAALFKVLHVIAKANHW